MKIYTHEKKDVYGTCTQDCKQSHRKVNHHVNSEWNRSWDGSGHWSKVVNYAQCGLQAKLSHIRLQPSTVKLHQYDGTTLPTKGEIVVNISTDQ